MEYLPESVRLGLEQARRTNEARKSRLQVEAGGRRIRVLRAWDKGFAVEAGATEMLRGLVDIYEGQRHVSRALIVTSREEEGELIYEFKRETRASDAPPVDFERPDNAPAGLLPRD
ncbi:hypothetical protein [Histidinibacterium aquaticum]|uniref:Uncharacterized protein n=1 Tax=Histidinibacterium aquaticum TaxID=2613962 RepID=A0A5J5GFR3_9RHOB|nr:hypothetical protein [Histidinibacterium aquaticum]KAA9007056.1 hypothetical protein F3S47_14930 [Histidinibacterium aquaticum]